MKKSICLYFQVHQPTQLRMYRFFEIGKDSHYYDDFAVRTILRRSAERCYLPMNALLLDLIKESKGKLKLAFGISGSFLEHCERHCPEVIDSFRALAETGCVEFVAEPYYHSLASLVSLPEFKHQVEKQKAAIEKYLGVKSDTFCNTELIYNDSIGAMAAEMGFKTVLTEGAKHILGWRSPNFVYTCAQAPKVKLLMRNSELSDAVTLRFTGSGLTSEQYLDMMKESAAESEIVNIFMDYTTFGEKHKDESGIFDFMKCLLSAVLADGTFDFATPKEVAKKHASVGVIDIPDTISWTDEERDCSAWLGNELQTDAFNKLYDLTEKLSIANGKQLWSDFGHLQESDNLYYMSTKFFSDGGVHVTYNPYDTPYEAFINFMNALSDFSIRVDDAINAAKEGEEKQQPEIVIVKPKNIPGKVKKK